MDEQCANTVIVNNEEFKQTVGKLVLSRVPASLDRAVAQVRGYGVTKYGDNQNWRKAPRQEYAEAFYRHANAMREHGIDAINEESGLPHLWHALCDGAFIVDLGEIRP